MQTPKFNIGDVVKLASRNPVRCELLDNNSFVVKTNFNKETLDILYGSK